jgi:PAS domain-containing protein
MPRNTGVFAPTFRGEGIVRSDDITKDPRYGHNPPYYGMPKGHLPVKSYLSLPVISMNGKVIGGLFFGHANPGIFTQESQELASSLTSQASGVIESYYLIRELDRSREGFSQLADAMPQIVWTAGSDGQPDYFNKKWYEFTGRNITDKKEWESVVHPYDKEQAGQKWKEAIESGNDFQVEYRL